MTVDDVDQLPEVLRSDDLAEPLDIDSEFEERPPRIELYPGEVTAAISFWQPDAEGKSSKYYDTRIRYINHTGPQSLKISVPAVDFLSTGTRVNVEEQAGGRIRVFRRAMPPQRGRSWRKPDVRSAMIGLAAVLLVTLVIGVIGYLVGRSKQPHQNFPTPTVTVGSVVPGGSPAQPSQPQQGQNSQSQTNPPGQ
ncbi:MAG TPA: hypothetical protein VHU91_04720 [Mycobacteriales bacterium]|nr:hypothetical protein [Mycobacteriales bacterium]